MKQYKVTMTAIIESDLTPQEINDTLVFGSYSEKLDKTFDTTEHFEVIDYLEDVDIEEVE